MSFSVVYGALVVLKSSFFWLDPNFLRKCSFAKQETEAFLLVKPVKSFYCCRKPIRIFSRIINNLEQQRNV